ncbi:OsmC family peroxiredoxin [Rhodohalobacter sp. SW132]|uniref:OsmC family protein n=1 Tax=Rhodohalobacter sp. SW132 TaxID=2293433 RepID=UPI000E2389C6|nr:OsmC family protein [Rhodohalobacter sp. SW132]REL24496.1 OsmC family peroxiredoxin [Rhodohalobacter sp. SW132]
MKNLPYSYSVDLNWKEGRKGTLSSSNLHQSVEVATPPEFKNGVEGIWSPEHLLVASVSSCFMTTFLAIAENSGLDFVTLDVNAVGLLDKKDGKFMITEIELEPELVISDDKYGEKALRIMHKAEAACLITNSLKTTIAFNPRVLIGEEAG